MSYPTWRDRLRHREPEIWGVVVVLLLAWSILMSGCGSRHKPPRPTPADYTPPTFTVYLDVDPRLGDALRPRPEDFAWTMEQACRAILEDARQRSGGVYRPPAMPFGHHDVSIRLERNCSTSGESDGLGAYGMIIKAARCDGTPVDPATMLSWACHRTGHRLGDFSGGNQAHADMARVLGC